MKLSDFEAVIFDMDGVLIDSEPMWKIAMEEVFLSVGCNLTRKDFQRTVGLRLDEVISYWHKEAGWEEVSQKEVENRIVERMITLIQENGAPLIGVIETLNYLSEHSFKIGLATSSYHVLIETVLKTLNIQDCFEVINSAEDEEYGKPHPAVYLTVAKKLGVNPLKCMVVEDSLNGIIAGKAARMKVVCIPEKTHHPEPKLIVADATFENMQQMLKALRSS
jgi:sugar-phosphatase